VVLDSLGIVVTSTLQTQLDGSGDALDAVICAFAAIAAASGGHCPPDPEAAEKEGWISVLQHRPSSHRYNQ